MHISCRLLLAFAAIIVIIIIGVFAVVSRQTSTVSNPITTPTKTATATATTAAVKNNVIVALGDSLTAASNSCGKADACLDNSWATGSNTAINSIATRIGVITGQTMTVYNYAHIGDKAEALNDQITKAIVQDPAYVTILMGSNDFCTDSVDQMTSVSDFQQTYEQAIARLHASLPNTKIILSSTVNPTSLWTNLRSNHAATLKWAAAASCQAMLANATSNDAAAQQQRQQVIDRAAQFNAVIQTVCATYKNNCLYTNKVLDFPYTVQTISTVDYLHPNPDGQALITQLVASTPGFNTFIKN